jgi:hypothetical protein
MTKEKGFNYIDMFRLTAIIADGEIKIKTAEYAYTENKLTYSILDSTMEVMKRVNKCDIDAIQTKYHEDRIAIAPYSIWTFYPENAKELLLIRVREEIKKRIDYVNTIKHLI